MVNRHMNDVLYDLTICPAHQASGGQHQTLSDVLLLCCSVLLLLASVQIDPISLPPPCAKTKLSYTALLTTAISIVH